MLLEESNEVLTIPSIHPLVPGSGRSGCCLNWRVLTSLSTDASSCYSGRIPRYLQASLRHIAPVSAESVWTHIHPQRGVQAKGNPYPMPELHQLDPLKVYILIILSIYLIHKSTSAGFRLVTLYQSRDDVIGRGQV